MTGFIYIIQLREFINSNEDGYKVGRIGDVTTEATEVNELANT